MKDVISEITLTNLAFNTDETVRDTKKVTINNVLDDRYAVIIQIGEWQTRIKKEDLKRIIG